MNQPHAPREAPRSSNIPRLLKVEEVADIFGVTTTTIYRKTRAGEIPAYKIGRYVRFNPEEIQRLIDAPAQAA